MHINGINEIFNENKNLNNYKIKENKKQSKFHRIFIKFKTKILTQPKFNLNFLKLTFEG
jgi:hypothetical protein